MQSESAKALSDLRDLAPVAELESRAAAGGQRLPRLKVNAHLHLPPNFSAFSTVALAVKMAAAQQVAVLGASNYYDYEVYGDFSRLAREQSIFPLYGLEIIALLPELQASGTKLNDPGNPGKLYLCGKGITRFANMTAKAQSILNQIRTNDSTRMAKVVQQLADVFAQRGVPTGLTESAVIDRIVRRHECPRNRVYLQERHVCQAFQERFVELVPANERAEKLTKVLGAATKAGPEEAVAIQNEIRSHLLKSGKPGYVPETFIGFDDAFRLITELGGIPCYPVVADGANPISPFEDPVDHLIAEIKKWNIGCAEFIPPRNKPDVLSRYVKQMRAAGIVVTAGTEHNTLDLIPIEPACVGSAAVPDDIQAIFWEGACVVAAHQYLTLNNQPGFIADCGEERIAHLSRLGAEVIQTYRTKK